MLRKKCKSVIEASRTRTNITTDSLFWAFHPLRASCFSVSLSLSPAAALWSVGYSCCVRATGGSNDFSPGQSRNQAALAAEQVVKLSMNIFCSCNSSYNPDGLVYSGNFVKVFMWGLDTSVHEKNLYYSIIQRVGVWY